MQKSIHTRKYAAFLRVLVATRKAAGVTQRELAKKLGATQSMVSKAENGQRRLDVTELMSWCSVLKKPFAEFAAELEEELGG